MHPTTTYTCLKYHLIFGTQYRRPLLLKPMHAELYAYIGGIIRDEGGNLDSIGGIADHVNILCGIPPRFAVSNMLRAINASSSKWINDNRMTVAEFQWQRGSAAFSVSKSNMPDVERYIENQEEHHHKISFEGEYRNFFIRHGITFEERYLFEDEHTS